MQRSSLIVSSGLNAALSKLRRAAQNRGSKPLSARAVSELCGVELKTVHNWVAQGLLAHFRTPGRHLRFQVADVLRFLESCGHPEAAGRPAVLIVKIPTVARVLKAQLEGWRVEPAADAYAGLIAIGRQNPELVVVHAAAAQGLNLGTWCGAVQRALPASRIVLIEATQGFPGVLRANAKGLSALLAA